MAPWACNWESFTILRSLSASLALSQGPLAVEISLGRSSSQDFPFANRCRIEHWPACVCACLHGHFDEQQGQWLAKESVVCSPPQKALA